MKTIAIIATALLISTAAFADNSESKRILTITDSFGRLLTMPVKVEEASEELPFNARDIFNEVRTKNSAQVFDISEMSRPESEEEIPAELQHIIIQ
jgi:hypothetical protein